MRVQDFCNIAYIFDVWSLGSILIEVLSGFPLWLSLKSRVMSIDGRSIINYGLFGVAGRDNLKILNKQNQLIGSGLNHLLTVLRKGFDYGGNQWVQNNLFLDLFNQILCMSPERRISPDEILEHDFFAYAEQPQYVDE